MMFTQKLASPFRLRCAALRCPASSCGFKRKKYENPITKDTQQPDKVLFDKAINDMERSRYEVARLTLQTLMNTYDTSEYLAKAKLAYADSWFREGGSHGLAQAEAEYKDFILFYPDPGRIRRSAGEGLHDSLPADGEGGPRHDATPCAPKMSAAICWSSSRTVSSRRKLSSSCVRFRK